MEQSPSDASLSTDVLDSSGLTRRLAVGFFLAVFALVLVRSAWVSDRAYVTFRVVENLIHGYGPVFNPGERVLPVAHPLWALVLAAADAVALYVLRLSLPGQLYAIATAAGGLCSAAAVGLLAARLSRSTAAAVFGLLVLTLSKAFVDYSTSGLENPLSHLLLAVFLVLFFEAIDAEAGLSRRRIFVLAVLLSLAALNRPEAALLLLPCLVWAVLRSQPRGRAAGYALAGLAPLAIAALASFIYYGSLLPTPATAWLGSGIGIGRFARQGLMYLLNSLDLDPVTLAVMAAGVVASVLWGERPRGPLLAGVVFYMGYIVLSGGGDLSGSMLSLPLFASVVMLARLPVSRTAAYETGLVVLIALGAFSPYSPVRSDAGYSHGEPDAQGIYDGRGVDYPRTGLLRVNRDSAYPPDSDWAGDDWHAGAQGGVLLVKGPFGIAGYAAGPSVYVLTPTGEADPLLSRLPVPDRVSWQVGDLTREMPAGYLETLESGQVRLASPALASYYEVLASVTRGRVWDPERLRAVWGLLLGRYDSLRRSYLSGAG